MIQSNGRHGAGRGAVPLDQENISKGENAMASQTDEATRTGPAPSRHVGLPAAGSSEPSNRNAAPPVKAGMKTGNQDTALFGEAGTDPGEHSTGARSVFALARRNGNAGEVPVFHGSDGDAVLVFSTREAAQLYRQIAEWDGYVLRELSALELSDWSQALLANETPLLLIDVNRHHHQADGDFPHRAVDLRTVQDLSGENLFQEIMARAVQVS